MSSNSQTLPAAIDRNATPKLSTARPSPERSHLPVAEFHARLRVLTQTLAVQDSREVVQKILSQGSGMKRWPLLNSAEREVVRLLAGKTRIYPARAGNVVNLHKDAVSLRDVLPMVSALALSTIEKGRAALQQASAMCEVRYWSNPFGGDDTTCGFEEATSGSVSSPGYLQWAISAARLSAHDQRAMRNYLALEVEVFGLQDRLGEQRELDRPGLDDLDGFRAQMPSRAADLIRDRPHPTDAKWPWLQPYNNGSNPWPFPAHLTGREDSPDLAAEASVLKALAGYLSRPPFDGLQSMGGEENGDNRDWQYARAVDAWSMCLNAGLALRYLASVLMALTQPESARHCDACYRYVAGGRRTRCFLHHSTSGDRNRELRLATYTKTFGERLAELRRELGRSPVYAHPARTLAQCWRFGRPAVPMSMAVRTVLGRWPAMNVEQAAGHLLDGLHKMVAKLAPIVGKPLHQRMERLANAVSNNIRRTLETRLTPTIDAMRNDRIRTSEEIERVSEQATAHGFFRLWFGGLENSGDAGELEPGTDVNHPFLHRRGTVSSARFHQWANGIASPLHFAIDLNTAVRDIVLHRAWLESGGQQADAAIERGRPVPTDRPRDRLDVQEAQRLRDREGKTFREIGALLGVSGPAVYLALKKLATAAPPAVKKVRKK